LPPELLDHVLQNAGDVAEIAKLERLEGLAGRTSEEKPRLGDMRACGAECLNFVVGSADSNVKLHLVIPPRGLPSLL
jgi:hypothetical protein